MSCSKRNVTVLSLNPMLDDVKYSLRIGHYEIDFSTKKTLAFSTKSFYLKDMTLRDYKNQK